MSSWDNINMSNSMKYWRKYVEEHPDTGHRYVQRDAVYERKSEPYFKIYNKEIDFEGFDVEYDAYSGEHKKQYVIIKFDPNVEYDALCAKQLVHDGTLYFTYECIEMLIKEFVTCNVWPLEKGSPKSGSHITYTVGDFVIINTNGPYGSDSKPWLHTKTTVVLPFKYNVEDM